MKYILLFLSLACITLACGKAGPVGPKGPDGQSYKGTPGNITGFIYLFDEFNHPLNNDSVLLKTTSGDTTFQTYTHADGKFAFPNLYPGNYDISVTKPGFDSLHLYVKHTGGPEDKFLGIDSLYQHVTATITSLTATLSSVSDNVYVNVDLVYSGGPYAKPNMPNFYLYIDSLPNVGPGQYRYQFSDIISDATKTDTLPGHLSVSFGFADHLYQPGDTVYVSVQVTPVYYVPRTTWLNYTTGDRVPYPYLGNAITSQLIWPARTH